MKLSSLLKSVTQNTASLDGVRWYPVRPMTAENTFFMQRVKAAWRVLSGTSDAIEWDCPTESKTPNVYDSRTVNETVDADGQVVANKTPNVHSASRRKVTRQS